MMWDDAVKLSESFSCYYDFPLSWGCYGFDPIYYSYYRSTDHQKTYSSSLTSINSSIEKDYLEI